jgi:predicted RNA methylase
MRQKTVKITDEVRDVLLRCTFTTSSVKLPEEKLPPPLYKAVNEVLTAQGGKWNRKLGVHLFPDGVVPHEVFGEALRSGVVVHAKKTRQAFYTPEPVARRVAKLAQLHKNDIVLEPSAGGGALVWAAIEAGAFLVVAVEQDATACSALTTEVARRALGDRVQVRCSDFLECTPRVGFEAKKRATDIATVNAVVMNPPFTGGQDIDHVRHAAKFLQRGGRMVAIMAGSLESGTTKRHRDFRTWLNQNATDWSIEQVEAGAFSESGTNVATVILSFDYFPEEKS